VAVFKHQHQGYMKHDSMNIKTDEEEVDLTVQDNKFNFRFAPFDSWEDGKLGLLSSS
jgi:hypothetical protein